MGKYLVHPCIRNLLIKEKNLTREVLSNLTIEEQQQIFKEIMGSYPTGVTIITTTDSNGNPVGLTVNSFTSVSLSPLLVLWCIDHKAKSYETFQECDGFAIHTLASDQKDLCWAFAGKEPDKFSKAKWSLSEYNLPILDGSYGVMQCKVVKRVDAGDHTILIGEAVELTKTDKDPMLYFRRNVGPIPVNWPASITSR